MNTNSLGDDPRLSRVVSAVAVAYLALAVAFAFALGAAALVADDFFGAADFAALAGLAAGPVFFAGDAADFLAMVTLSME